MKTIKQIATVAAILVLVIAIYTGCQREILGRTDHIQALKPSSPDTGAYKWKPILLSSATEFAMDVPLPTSSPDYKLELLEIKSRQKNISQEDRKKLDYWAAGAVLRWNEILRELVAKYNLPPKNNADGTYPAPNAANPLANPAFPFANPPYAARAYAYVAAAQYDALIAAYHYKTTYKRPKPAAVDNTISELIPITEGYCYPSEAAVVSGAAAAVMTLLFPGEQDYIQSQLTDCKNARILSGGNSRSDMDAGEKLGKLVAGKFITRARNDRAGKAIGTPADWAMLQTKAENKGEVPWISLESPKRPPMLPLFGNVLGFLMDTTEVINGRPVPPPSTQSQQFKDETEEVLKYSKTYDRDKIAIVHFWADGVGTYAPPGHWNAIACEDFIGQNWSEVRWARNLALLNMSLFQAAICCWDAKYYYFNPRPTQTNPNIKTWTGIPNFPAYTSGHSTFSGAAARILSHLVKSRASYYDALAMEASLSRLYGAIHYRSDCEVGLKMGNMIGDIAIDRAKTDGAE